MAGKPKTLVRDAAFSTASCWKLVSRILPATFVRPSLIAKIDWSATITRVFRFRVGLVPRLDRAYLARCGGPPTVGVSVHHRTHRGLVYGISGCEDRFGAREVLSISAVPQSAARVAASGTSQMLFGPALTHDAQDECGRPSNFEEQHTFRGRGHIFEFSGRQKVNGPLRAVGSDKRARKYAGLYLSVILSFGVRRVFLVLSAVSSPLPIAHLLPRLVGRSFC